MIELLEGEIFLPVAEFPQYSISNYARVWSSLRGGNLIRAYYHHTYVHRVKLGRKYQRKLHTLVGRAHLPEYKEGLYILHKDETLSYPQIHYADNLWVGTHQDNMTDMATKGRRKRSEAAL